MLSDGNIITIVFGIIGCIVAVIKLWMKCQAIRKKPIPEGVHDDAACLLIDDQHGMQSEGMQGEAFGSPANVGNESQSEPAAQPTSGRRGQIEREITPVVTETDVATVVTETDMMDIVDTFNFSALYEVYILLGLRAIEIENAKLASGKGYRNQATYVLNLWRDRLGAAATRENLFQAMEQGRASRAPMEKLKKKWGYTL